MLERRPRRPVHSAIIFIMHLETHFDGNILLLRIANPPVNSLSWELRKQLHHAFTVSAADARIDAVILYGAGQYFCAGGDLRELGTPAASAPPRLSADVLLAIERCEKPVIAAIHGAAIGGGFELALACHYRIALDSTRIALPEVQHGIIPLSGTLRLARLWGIARALPMMPENLRCFDSLRIETHIDVLRNAHHDAANFRLRPIRIQAQIRQAIQD